MDAIFGGTITNAPRLGVLEAVWVRALPYAACSCRYFGSGLPQVCEDRNWSCGFLGGLVDSRVSSTTTT